MMINQMNQSIKTLRLKSQRRRSPQRVKNRILQLKPENKILIKSDRSRSEYQLPNRIKSQVQEVQLRRKRKDWKDFLVKSDKTQQGVMIPQMKSHQQEGIKRKVVVKEQRKSLIIGLIWFSFGSFTHIYYWMIRSNCTFYLKLQTFLLMF